MALALAALELDNVRRLHEMQHAQHCCALDYLAGQEAFGHHWEAANDLVGKVRKAYFPWLKEEEKGSDRDRAFADMRKQYVAVFGDPGDPKVQEGIQATVRELMNR